MIGIYKITNNLNQKSYIGQSIDILTRWKQHIYEANHNRLNNTIYQAIRKYGIDNFTFSVLEECQKEQLNEVVMKFVILKSISTLHMVTL